MLSAGTASASLPGKGYADVVASTRGLQALAAKAVLSSPALKLDGFSRPPLKPVPASSSNASEYASSAQGNKEVYSSSPLSAGTSDTCYSRKCLRWDE